MFGLFEGGNIIGDAYKIGGSGAGQQLFAILFFVSLITLIIWWVFIRDKKDKNNDVQSIIESQS